VPYPKTLDQSRLGSEVTQFGNNKPPQGMSCVFNKTMVIHGVNTGRVIVEEMNLAEAALSLRWIGTGSVSKLFGGSRVD
jgi:hypothetical protein